MPRWAACGLPEWTMPRKSRADVQADMRARRALGEVGSDRISQLPGLSSRGRSVLARLEVTRLWQGQAEQALRYWREYQRDPYHSRWDRPDSCGEWACCPDIDEVRAVLRTVVRSLPTREARRLRAAIAAFGEDALNSLTLLLLSSEPEGPAEVPTRWEIHGRPVVHLDTAVRRRGMGRLHDRR
jgi:hypothetical protein